MAGLDSNSAMWACTNAAGDDLKGKEACSTVVWEGDFVSLMSDKEITCTDPVLNQDLVGIANCVQVKKVVKAYADEKTDMWAARAVTVSRDQWEFRTLGKNLPDSDQSCMGADLMGPISGNGKCFFYLLNNAKMDNVDQYVLLDASIVKCKKASSDTELTGTENCKIGPSPVECTDKQKERLKSEPGTICLPTDFGWVAKD